MAVDTLSISKVYVIESLSDEVKTGKIIYELISGQIAEAGKKVPVDYILCETRNDFSNLLLKIKEEAEAGVIPLLQIECHGDQYTGLIFNNGSSISWDELRKLVAPINIATNFSLVLCLSACDAGHFLGSMGRPAEACPCRILIAPSDTVWPHECIAGFRTFYNAIFNNSDAINALNAVQSLRPEQGEWICELAERWFLRISTDYFKVQCSRDAIDARARALFKGIKKQGVHKSMGSIRRELLKKTGTEWLDDMFVKFFALDIIPENRKKFSPVYKELVSWVKMARDKGIIGF